MPYPYFTRPPFEDRQIVQYSGRTITLSGDTNINPTGNFRIYKDAFPGLVATSLDSNGTVGWGPISGISWSVSACTSPLYVNHLVSCPLSGGTIQVDAGNLLLNSELSFGISLSAGTNNDEILVVDGSGNVKKVPNVGGVGNMWYIPLGYTLTVPDNYQSFIYGDLYVLGTIDLQTNAQLVVLNGNIILSGGSIVGSGTTYLVTLGGGSGCCFTGGTGSCITDLYVTNIHGCSPIHIQPTSSDDVIMVEGGGNVGIDVIPSYKLHISGRTSNTEVRYDDNSPTPSFNMVSNNGTDLSFFGIFDTDSNSGFSLVFRGFNEPLYSAYGKPGDATLYASVNTNGLNIMNNNGTGKEDYIRFYAGTNASTDSPDVHIQGTGTTRGFVGIGTKEPTSKVHIKGSSDVNTTYSLKIDDYLDNPILRITDSGNIYSVGKTYIFSSAIFPDTNIDNFETDSRGIRMFYSFTGDVKSIAANVDISGRTVMGIGSSSNGVNTSERDFTLQNHGSNFIRNALFPTNGRDFYQNKGVLNVGTNLDGMVINLDPTGNSSRLWFEQNANSPMVIAGGGSPSDLRLGIALNPNGTELPTSTLQVGGTGTTGTVTINQDVLEVSAKNTYGKIRPNYYSTVIDSSNIVTDGVDYYYTGITLNQDWVVEEIKIYTKVKDTGGVGKVSVGTLNGLWPLNTIKELGTTTAGNVVNMIGDYGGGKVNPNYFTSSDVLKVSFYDAASNPTAITDGQYVVLINYWDGTEIL